MTRDSKDQPPWASDRSQGELIGLPKLSGTAGDWVDRELARIADPQAPGAPTGETFFDCIAEAAQQDMIRAGVEPWADMTETAEYVLRVQAIQANTFRWLADQCPADNPMRKLFNELAEGVQAVPPTDLIMGEPGASGGM